MHQVNTYFKPSIAMGLIVNVIEASLTLYTVSIYLFVTFQYNLTLIK